MAYSQVLEREQKNLVHYPDSHVIKDSVQLSTKVSGYNYLTLFLKSWPSERLLTKLISCCEIDYWTVK